MNVHRAKYFDFLNLWQTTVLSAIGSRQKTPTLPGGYLVWNSAWPEAGRSKMADDAISKFLVDWESLSSSVRQTVRPATE